MLVSDRLSAATDAHGQLNVRHSQRMEDLRQLIQTEIHSRKQEQRSVRASMQVLARSVSLPVTERGEG
jgi:hypothetical protein